MVRRWDAAFAQRAPPFAPADPLAAPGGVVVVRRVSACCLCYPPETLNWLNSAWLALLSATAAPT